MLENKNGPIVTDYDVSKEDLNIIMLSPLIIGISLLLWELEYIFRQVSIGDEIERGFVVLVTITSVFFICFGWMGYTDHKAYFDYSAEGLGVKYLLQKRKVIPWDEFQEVCVCYASYSTRGERTAHSVLCFVKKGEKRNLYGRWKADNPFRSRSVIAMDYTDELYEEVQKHCPYKIPDLRGKGNYRL